MIHHTNQPVPFRRPGGRRRAFTLVEVMISVALVLLLIYGVAQVFKLTGDAVGANQAVSRIIRDHRATSATLSDDFRSCVSDSPLFLISSRIAYTGTGGLKAGFKREEEERNNNNADPTFVDGSFRPHMLLGNTDRVPRLDRLGFFVRGIYHRQTTPDLAPTAAVPLATSNEAYVWYGHTVNAKTGVYPQEQYAAERILGRVAILMKAKVNTLEAPLVGGASTALWPFAYDAGAHKAYSDLTQITIDQFRQSANAEYQPSGPAIRHLWYLPMEDANAAKVMRFWCNPTVARPIDSAALSKTVPFFLENCTQFIVEYSGDYLNQDPITGDLKHGPHNVTAAGDPDNDVLESVEVPPPGPNPTYTTIYHGQTDGVPDFVVDKSADPSGTNPALWVHRLRWYGLPRDVNGDNAININDVIPLADLLDWNGYKVNSKAAQASWEKDLPTPGMMPSKDYVTANTPPAAFKYTCAWHNDAPAMIRVLVKIDDPKGKIQDGQWYEYVLTR